MLPLVSACESGGRQDPRSRAGAAVARAPSPTILCPRKLNYLQPFTSHSSHSQHHVAIVEDKLKLRHIINSS